MKRLFQFLITAFSATCLFPQAAFAHLVNTDVGEFYAGMMHAFLSADHFLPMTALAILASQAGKKAGRVAVILFPVTLIAAMAIAPYLDIAKTAHLANLVTLGVLGICLVFFNRLNPDKNGLWLSIAATVIVALILGYRSGVDMTNARVGVQFIPGVGLTGFIFMVLCIAWLPKSRDNAWEKIRVVCGILFFIAGSVLVYQFFFPETTATGSGLRMPTQDSIAAMMAQENLNTGFIVATLFAAFIWGAGHALTPGHGKAIVGAYLVGAHSSALHAVYLGLTVTITHTLGVFLLGLVAVFASQYILPEDLYPYLGAVSGLIVLFLGATMVWRRIHHSHGHHHGHDHSGHHDHTHRHDHDHDNCDHDDHSHHHHDHHHHSGHSHLPPGTDGSAVTWKSLLGLGISGGLLPCPSALVLLLTAISFKRPEFGMAMVIFFSLGLAGILTCVGLLFVKGSKMLKGISAFEKSAHYLPLASAVIIMLIGIVITWNAARPLFL